MKKVLHVFFAAVFAAVAAFADDPVAEWVMWDSDGIVKNAGLGGEAGNLTLSEGVAFSDDVHVGNTGGTALRISGEDQTAAAETDANFDPLAGAEKFTIMAWVRRESEDPGDNTNACIFSDFAYIDGHPCGIEFRFDRAQGNLYLRVNGSGGSLYAARIPADNWTWRHVAVSCDMTIESPSANTHFYIDGIQVGAGLRLYQQLDGPAANNVPVTIGNSASDRSSENQLVGSIDDVFVFADWAPEPSGNGNLNTAIREWMLIDDSTRIPEDEPEPEPEPEEDWTVPPVMVGDVIAQKWGEERNYEELAEGLIFVNAETGDLWYANEENPHGRAICVCKPFPDWHRFKDTVWFLGHVLQLNDHYSMQAEAHTLSIRYGGEAVWRILGDENGDLAGILTIEVEDENHLLIQANATGTNVVLQVCTNLMEATPWKPAENAVIYTQTDAATTWRATLLSIDGFSGVELYRVLNGNNPRPAGVYCERPLRANKGVIVPDGQSLSLGGVERSTWPDTSGIAENRLAIGAVATNLATHAARTDNPHGVTAAQIGALTAETDAAALEALGTHTADTSNPHNVTAEQIGALTTESDATALAALGAHTGNTSNPHSVTAAQVGAIPTSWTNAAEVKSLTIGEGTCTNLAELASTGSVSAVSGRVSAIEADYVKAADIADFATTQDVASVERRVSALEVPDTCILWWTTNLATGGRYWVPTNFPTRRLVIRLDRSGLSDCIVYIDSNWDPGRNVEIDILSYASSNGTNTFRIRNGNTSGSTNHIFSTSASGTASRMTQADFDVATGEWMLNSWAVNEVADNIGSAIRGGDKRVPTGPATVEEWLALYEQRKTTTP